MAVSLDHQRSIIHDCLNGTSSRDCGRCEANHSRGGICCFGRKYEPGDADCSRCRHRSDCERLSHSFQPPAPRPGWPSGSRPIISQGASPSIGVRHVTPPNAYKQPTAAGWPATRPAVAPIQANQAGAHPYLAPAGPREDEAFPKFVTRVGVHGALEGALTFLLQLLQMRRPF